MSLGLRTALSVWTYQEKGEPVTVLPQDPLGRQSLRKPETGTQNRYGDHAARQVMMLAIPASALIDTSLQLLPKTPLSSCVILCKPQMLFPHLEYVTSPSFPSAGYQDLLLKADPLISEICTTQVLERSNGLYVWIPL